MDDFRESTEFYYQLPIYGLCIHSKIQKSISEEGLLMWILMHQLWNDSKNDINSTGKTQFVGSSDYTLWKRMYRW
jgi:hypothetical protein